MSRTASERHLAAILVADIVGYSRFMGADEEGTLRRLRSLRSGLLDPKIKQHGGRIVKSTGDGVLVEFSSAVQAVKCAVEVQRSMMERDLDVPQPRRIYLRIGINLGELLIQQDGDVFGDAVNLAARLEAANKMLGTRILVSVATREAAGQEFRFRQHGPVALPGRAQAEIVFELEGER